MGKKQKKLKQDRRMTKKQEFLEDRISALPDSLIHHILSFLGIKDTVKTSILSKRWRKVWTSTPVLKFDWSVITAHETPERARLISSLLSLYEAPQIKEFEVSFDYSKVDTSIIDSWIDFAVRHDVESLRMYFLDDIDVSNWEDHWEDDMEKLERLYDIPQCLFSCRSLKLLDVEFCDLNVFTTFRFGFLKTLRLRGVNFNSLDTSYCPLLEDVSLVHCNTASDLNMHSPNERFKRVEIRDHYTVVGRECGLSIYAPKLLTISFSGCVRSNYNIKDLSSIVSADFEFERMLYEPIKGTVDQALPLLKLFGNLSHVRTLKLCQWCIQVLSFADMKGWSKLAYYATHLKVATNLQKLDLPGLACLLRASPHLQILTLKVDSRWRNAHFWRLLDNVDETLCWQLFGLELSSSFHLKTVEINDFLHSSNFSTFNNQTPTGELLKLWKNQIKLVEMLLVCCKELDKLHINLMRYHHLKLEWLLMLTKKLLVFPRVSANAEIYFS